MANVRITVSGGVTGTKFKFVNNTTSETVREWTTLSDTESRSFSVTQGNSITVTCVSVPTGYKRDYWTSTTASPGKWTSDSVTWSNAYADNTFELHASLKTYIITPSVSGNGTVRPNTSFSANYHDQYYIGVEGNVFYVGNTAITATPNASTVDREHYFSYWKPSPATVGYVFQDLAVTAYFGSRDRKYTITFKGNGGTISGKNEVSYEKTWNTTFGAPSATRSQGSDKYTATFYDGNTELYTREIPYKINYAYDGYNATGEGSGERNITVSGDATYKACWSPTSLPGKISDFPSSYSKNGYKFNGWYDAESGGSQIKSTSTFNSDVNVYAGLIANQYTVEFSIRRGVESWVDASNSSFTKTFDEDVILPENKVYRYGYKFMGWCNKSDVIESHGEASIKYAYGGTFDDRIYAGNGYTGKKITLYPWFEPIDNTIHYKYYTNDGTYHEEEVETYNIETTANNVPYKKENPHNPFIIGNNDYTFLGWTNTKPEGEGWVWGDGSDKGKGLFLNPEEANFLHYVNPLTIYTNSKTEWGTNEVYYCLWTKTGKYIKTRDGWKKVSTAYVKTTNGWKAITDAYICIQSVVKDSEGTVSTPAIWKHEI